MACFILLYGGASFVRGAAASVTSPQDAECESDRNLLLQLPGVRVDPLVVGAEGISANLALGKEDLPPGWEDIHNHTKVLMKDMKMNKNAEGDLETFIQSLAIDSSAVVIICVVFSLCIRGRYPMVYSDNLRKGTAPDILPDSCFGWIRTSWHLTFEEIEKASGLDAAMFIEFSNLAVRMLVTIGLPMAAVLCPLHHFFGGHVEKGVDKLSKVGMGNIDQEVGGRWFYWVHACFVWYVVVLALRQIFIAQEKFLERRYEWLLKMPMPRSSTVMVEGIPEECCNDAALKAHFEEMFPGQVTSAYVVRHTANLVSLVDAYNCVERSHAEAEFEWQASGNSSESRPQCRDGVFGNMVDKIDFQMKQKSVAAEAVKKERLELADPRNASRVYASSGFVTFENERDAAVALCVKMCADDYVFMMSEPPDPADVTYSDLYTNPELLNFKALLGYSCIAGVFFGFTPIVMAISSIINLTTLRKALPVVDDFIRRHPWSEHTIEGVVASSAMTIMVSMMPTVLMLIINNLFQLKAGRWAQHKLQNWYFWFQVIFVLLVTTLGNSLFDTMLSLVNHPTLIFELLAYRLPLATHFYLNYLVLQWVLHLMNLTRYINFFKFKGLSAICEEERAKELSEPEDQDYYGIGGRSARFAINLVMALMYSNLCPLISVVALINFLICKVVYGYLLVFAESVKPDLGGHFWVTQLRQIQAGLLLYVLLMLGILSSRSPSFGPTVVAAPALLFVLRGLVRFHSAYEWERMPFEALVKGKAAKMGCEVRESSRKDYTQPELLEPDVDEA